MGELFGVTKKTISEHLGNIYGSNELQREATVRNFRTVQQEGERMVNRDLEYYNLDAIISVGYRVNSSKATQFRITSPQSLPPRGLCGTTRISRRNERNVKKWVLEDK